MLRCVVWALTQQTNSNLIFDLFDDLLLLAPGGRTVFSGASSRALKYFAALGFPCPPKGNPVPAPIFSHSTSLCWTCETVVTHSPMFLCVMRVFDT
jgi:hypothetical protein